MCEMVSSETKEEKHKSSLTLSQVLSVWLGCGKYQLALFLTLSLLCATCFRQAYRVICLFFTLCNYKGKDIASFLPISSKACLHLMVGGGFIPEGAPDGSASRLPEALEEPALACPAPEEEAPASEAAPEGQGVGSGVRGRA